VFAGLKKDPLPERLRQRTISIQSNWKTDGNAGLHTRSKERQRQERLNELEEDMVGDV
jgi:hypothetical protein